MTGRRWVVCALGVAGLLYLILIPFGFGQEHLFPHKLLCDYRCFISPVIEQGVTYVPKAAFFAKDACYPPLAYDLIRGFFGCSKSAGWTFTATEAGLDLSILALQLLGLFCLVRVFDRRSLASAAVVLVTPAFLCPILRANPVGWSFAFVCFFLKWYDSPRRGLRVFAAFSLAMAAALKISPCIYGMMYITFSRQDGFSVRWRDVLSAAAVAILLVFVPFCWHGGFDTVLRWIANAAENARFYSCDDPIWGLVPFASRFTASAAPVWLVQTANAMTKAATLALLLLTPFCRTRYLKLLFLGSAMTFLTYHDYGALYLLPPFFVWLDAEPSPVETKYRIAALLVGICWIAILMPLQIWSPFFGSLNQALQGEAQLLILGLAFADFVATSDLRELWYNSRHNEHR